MYVEHIQMKGLKRQAPKSSKENFFSIIAESIALRVIELDVELSILSGQQIEFVIAKDSQTPNSLVGREQFRARKQACGSENKCPVQQFRANAGHRLCSHLDHFGFADPVPILERCFEISLQVINGGQKIIAVGIVRGQLQSPAQETLRLAVAFFFEFNACQL